MDLGGEFCLVCGGQPPLFSGRMCEKCSRARVNLAEVPKNAPWTKCARCGLVDFQGKWTNVDSEDLWYELVQRKVEFHTDIEDLQRKIAQKLGFKLVDHKLELYGSKIKKN